MVPYLEINFCVIGEDYEADMASRSSNSLPVRLQLLCVYLGFGPQKPWPYLFKVNRTALDAFWCTECAHFWTQFCLEGALS